MRTEQAMRDEHEAEAEAKLMRMADDNLNAARQRERQAREDVKQAMALYNEVRGITFRASEDRRTRGELV